MTDARPDRHWFKLPVPLDWLCSLDEYPATNALASALGDRYLYSHNAIYAGVRDAATLAGYRFSSEDSPLWRDYQAFGLTTLHRILAERTIPYVDTVTTVRRVLQANPKMRIAPGYLLAGLRANHAFHESAHCIARSVLDDLVSELRVLVPDAKGRFVLASILCESFANVVEKLGSIMEGQLVADTVFFSLNSYLMPKPARTEVLKAAGHEIGSRMRFATLFLASFEANLTGEQPAERLFERVFRASGAPASSEKTVRRLTEAGFDLSGGFRSDTTPMYFDLLGHRKEYLALAAAEWLGDSHHCRFIEEFVGMLFESVGG